MMKNSWLVLCVLHWILLTWVAFPAVCQEEDDESDSTIIVDDTLQIGTEGAIGTGQPGVETAPDTAVIEKVSKGHIPRKAALFSAVLPGLGQIYNNKYWKVPIIYAGFAALGYTVILNNDRYQLYRRAFIAVRTNTIEENPLRDLSPRSSDVTWLSNVVDQLRRNRDYVIIIMAGLYGLQIMDAIVDAHLIEFEVNDKLTLALEPSTGGSDAFNTPVLSYGLALTLRIK